nr:helix-turn-helix transcriptional regulator [Brevundimonas diminuta]
MDRSKRQGRVQGDRPAPVSFRTEAYGAGTVFPKIRQPWGELNYALSGVLEIIVEGKRILSPPTYGVWIPPMVEHEARNANPMIYVTVYMDAQLCGDLPKEVGTIELTPLLKAVLADFASREITVPTTPQDKRLAQVLIDQIHSAPQFDSYLPMPQDPVLGPIALALQADSGSREQLSDWAALAGVTERTLSRRWQSSTGVSFNEWRQRLRAIDAIALLEQGELVQNVARQVGYNDASAFIAMFRRVTGIAPTSLRPSGPRQARNEEAR